MTRTQTRRLTFELLYSLEIQKVALEEKEEQINLFLEQEQISEAQVKEYMLDVINGIDNNEEEILKLISQNLKQEWDISRISKVNLVLLKLAIYEMIYSKVPYKVVVNEAVELAKKYGDDNSPSFVNGILAKIIKQLGIMNEE